MIISASRRTDIPAFYAKWFMNRIRAGFCTVPNPFNRRQVSTVSLKPEDVDVIVFWTRNPRPLLQHLAELDGRGYRYVFLFTLMNNPPLLDPHSPAAESGLECFMQLADRIGPEKITWRYDPIVFSNLTDPEFHQENFDCIARKLSGYTHRSVISRVNLYRKVRKRLLDLGLEGLRLEECNAGALGDLMAGLADTARENGMEIHSCADETELARFGIRPGKCIDGERLSRLFGLPLSSKQDPCQRKTCGCVASKDVGMYDSCLYGCRYCYATVSVERARMNHAAHDSASPSLLGHCHPAAWSMAPAPAIAECTHIEP